MGTCPVAPSAQEGLTGILKGVGRRLVSSMGGRRATVFVRSLGDIPKESPPIPVVMRDMATGDLKRFADRPSRLPNEKTPVNSKIV